MTQTVRMLVCLCMCGSVLTLAQGQDPAEPQEPSRQRSQVDLIIGDQIGAQPTFAVPDCLAPAGDEVVDAAGRTIAEVLWDDLAFEREFRMLARDTYSTISRARSLTDLPLDQWRELGADGVLSCTVAEAGAGRVRVTARLFNTRSLASAFGVEYTGSVRNVRVYAHQLSDEIHRHQRGLRGRRENQDLVCLRP